MTEYRTNSSKIKLQMTRTDIGMALLLPYQYPAARNETMRLIALMAMQMAVKNHSNLEILILSHKFQLFQKNIIVGKCTNFF